MAEQPTNPTGQTGGQTGAQSGGGGGNAGNDVAPSASTTLPASPKSTSSPAADAALEAAKAAMSQLGDLNQLVNEASNQASNADAALSPSEQESAARVGAAKPVPPGASPLQLPNLSGDLSASQVHALDLLGDVHLNVKIELGRTRMLVEDLLRLSEGAVVELDKLAGDPVDVYVNERHVARGEVLVLNDNFCVRINEVLTTSVGTANEKGAA